ncbi:hypothetical protein TNCV_4251261 [Trichonephila clavipes]|nr:hypothetical protein TNCV_4251261 [Trichonephila clavipes]
MPLSLPSPTPPTLQKLTSEAHHITEKSVDTRSRLAPNSLIFVSLRSTDFLCKELSMCSSSEYSTKEKMPKRKRGLITEGIQKLLIDLEDEIFDDPDSDCELENEEDLNQSIN